MVRIAHNDVIQNLDLQQLTCTDEVSSHFDVPLGWLGLSAGMIMGKDNCRGGAYNGRTEDFSGMDENGVERADGD